MDAISGLQKMMQEAEDRTKHDGYWYSISETLIIMVCGMLCSLQTIDDIHEWSKAAPVQAFLKERFWIEKIPCRAQFYNILGCVDAGKFNKLFIKWMQGVLHGGLSGKTVAIDGKTICSTGKRSEDGSVLHIASAIVSEYGMVIGSQDCGTVTDEITAFRELVGLLDISGAVVVADACFIKRRFHFQNIFFCIFKHSVKTAYNRHRQYNVAVFSAHINVAQTIVGNAPY